MYSALHYHYITLHYIGISLSIWVLFILLMQLVNSEKNLISTFLLVLFAAAPAPAVLLIVILP